MESVLVRNIRVSFIFFQNTRNQWFFPESLYPQFGFLRDLDLFNLELERRVEKKGNRRFTLPWQEYGDNHFWENYLVNANYKQSKLLQKKLIIPLREKPKVGLWVEDSEATIIPELFYFPFGVALIMTVNIRSKPITLETMTHLLHRIRHKQTIVVDFGSDKVKKVKLNKLASSLFDSVFKQMFKVDTPIQSIDPFSQFSIIQGCCPNSQKIVQGDEIHRTLEAITSWRKNWENDNPLPDITTLFQNDFQASKQNTTNPRFYCHRRGHAIWIPEQFNSDEPHQHNLSCFSRNQLFANLLTEAIGNFLSDVSNRIDDCLHPEEARCACLCSELIGRMYGGGRDTYISVLVRRHIDDQESWIKEINNVRDHFGLLPLH